MDETRVKELLAGAGAIIEGHFVGTSGNHLSVYVAKDRATRLTSIASELCQGIAEQFASADVDAVVAPAVGGIALSQWTAHHLTMLRPDRQEVVSLYSEHDDEVLRERKKDDEPFAIALSLGMENTVEIQEGEKVILRKSGFVLGRGFAKDVHGVNVLEIEDILTTGGSAAETAKAITLSGGNIVGLGVLVNGGSVTPQMCGVGRLVALMDVDRQIFTEKDCAELEHGLCARGVPINTDFGHGKAFLARKAETS